MTRLQFRVLYREFLWRLFDVELLSADALGDASKLLGRFAALIIMISLFLAAHALGFGGNEQPPELRLAMARKLEHFLIALTMVVVGLFAVLSWDSTFPDRRDVLILTPLPVRARMLFLAKASAMATALGLAVLLLHCAAGLIWPFVLAEPGRPFPGFLAYWGTMFGAGGFVFCCVLVLQGLAAQLLPRRAFLRLSSLLQLAAFSAILGFYMSVPMLPEPAELIAASGRGLLALSPTYWFVGLFQQLNGSPALPILAQRAWIGLGLAGGTAALTYGLCYSRTMRQIIEEPDIVPRTGGGVRLPRFGGALQTALVRFSIRTLLRSRLHRLILVFYLGTAFAFLLFLLKQTPDRSVGVPLIGPSIVMMAFSMVGTRVTFPIPLDLRANWIFRLTAVRRVTECLCTGRRALLLIAVAPVWLASAIFSFHLLPRHMAAGQLALLTFFALAVMELCLRKFEKIPFTCSYLPGKSQLHIAVLSVCYLLWVVRFNTASERQLLESPARLSAALITLALVWLCLRWHNSSHARSGEAEVQFEESETPAVQGLGLNRDGSWLSDPPVPS